MPDGRIIVIIAVITGLVWVGGESIKGLRWIKHHTKDAIHHIIHPHSDGVKK